MPTANDNQMQACFENAPEILHHLYTKIAHLGKTEAGLTEESAKRLAVSISKTFVEDFGGEVIYIPKSILLPLSGRDWAIYNEFNGDNHNELARKYKVSVAWVYKIIKRVHKEEIAKRQIDLFSEAA